MTTLELKLNLPDELAQRAQSAGLLAPEAIESMLREQLKKQAGEQLRATWARMPHEELTPQVEEDFVEFLAAKTRKRTALDRLLAIAPALAAAGVTPMSEEEIAAEVKAARAERRAKTSN